MRYYSGNFALRKPSWSLPEVGGVQGILTPGGPDVGLVRVQVAGDQVNSGGCWTRGAGGTWKRVRLTKKTASSLVRKHGALHVLHGKRWKRLRALGEVLDWGACSNKRERLSLHEHGFFSSGGGWVVPHGLSALSRVSRFVLN